MIVVITGASRGIGKAIAKIFAQPGHTLLLNARQEGPLQELAVELQETSGAKVLAHAADLALPDEARAFGRWCLHQGTPDILVNNAGSFLPGNIHEEEEGTLQQMVETNLYSAYHLTRSLLPAMMKRESGHIFNMCSIASLQAYPSGGSYSISKFALAGFSKNLREELKQYRIKVTAVYPGAVYTDSWAGSGVSPQRIIEAEDIAKMIHAASFLSPQACPEEIVIRPQLGDL